MQRADVVIDVARVFGDAHFRKRLQTLRLGQALQRVRQGDHVLEGACQESLRLLVLCSQPLKILLNLVGQRRRFEVFCGEVRLDRPGQQLDEEGFLADRSELGDAFGNLHRQCASG